MMQNPSNIYKDFESNSVRPLLEVKVGNDAERYQYSPLDNQAQEIRLLTLLLGPFSSKFRISLEIIPFNEHFTPQFEALSCTWGLQQSPVDLSVESSGSNTLALSVTQHLAEALLYLRYKDRPRVLWVDTICVNQQDLEERGLQIMRMADIFSKHQELSFG